MIQFFKGANEYFILAILRNDFSMIQVPTRITRARKNSVELFSEIAGTRVTEVFCVQYERCICFMLSDGYSVLLKMFGNQSNFILCRNDEAVSLFKQKLRDDLNLSISKLQKKVSVSKEALKAADWDFCRILPVFGGAVKKQIDRLGYKGLDGEGKWELVENTLNQLNSPEFFIYYQDGMPVLTLFEPQNKVFHSTDVIEALNEFFRQFITVRALIQLRKAALRTLEKQKRNAENLVVKSRNRLEQLEQQVSYREQADLIMAYMHLIKPGVSLVHLPHFETGEPVPIKLKVSLSAQKNAEQYYRKSKNQLKEVKVLKDNAASVQVKIKSLAEQIEYIHNCQDLKLLKKFLKDNQLAGSKKASSTEKLFKRFQCQQFVILVGRNAANNDLLTQKHAHKEDLWLHARDVKGSHVVIKQIPGMKFPEMVIEKAAQLAAYYSKRRNDTLCPVIYTEKKYVRKPKGSIPGQVVLERENVLMVKPNNEISQQ